MHILYLFNKITEFLKFTKIKIKNTHNLIEN